MLQSRYKSDGELIGSRYVTPDGFGCNRFLRSGEGYYFNIHVSIMRPATIDTFHSINYTSDSTEQKFLLLHRLIFLQHRIKAI